MTPPSSESESEPLTLRSARGVAATGSPLATRAALDVLRRGGNAVDAAVAAAAVQSVVEFPWGGMGGDAFLLVGAPDGRVAALNGSGAAPAELSPVDCVGQKIPRFGPLSAAVPGFAGALCAAQERFGSRPLSELFEAAVCYARQGFALSPELCRAMSRLYQGPQQGDSLLVLFEGNGAAPGEQFRQPQLASTLEAVADGGVEAFYQGLPAAALSARVRESGGLLSVSDFASHSTEWVNPISVDFRGVRAYTQPPVSLGCVLLLLLKMYERLGLPPLPFDDPVRVDAMVRSKHAAFAAVLACVTDHPSAAEQVEALLSQEHVELLCDRLFTTPPRAPARPLAATEGADTTCTSVLDGRGMSVTLIHSLFNEFGSRVYEPSTGVLLNDRLANQSVGSGPKEIIGGRKPLHTLNSYLLERNGVGLMAGATPGGRGQVQFNLQVIVNVLEVGMSLGDAVRAPRWLSGAPRRPEPNDDLYLERGFRAGTADEMRRRGHKVTETNPEDSDLFGSVVLVGQDDSGSLLAAADHRREAASAGY